MGTQLEISKQSKIAEMLAAGFKQSAIIRETGVSEYTVNKYKKQFENDEDAFYKRLESNIKAEEVKNQIKAGYSLNQIVSKSNVSPKYVMKKADLIAKEEKTEIDLKTEIEMWIKTHWHWNSKQRVRRRINPKTGLRIVYVGERGSLRTPYRPDGIWR